MTPDELIREMQRLDILRSEREAEILEKAIQLGGSTSPESIRYRAERDKRWRDIHFRHLELSNELARLRRER